jgi:hypothetical protein
MERSETGNFGESDAPSWEPSPHDGASGPTSFTAHWDHVQPPPQLPGADAAFDDDDDVGVITI